MSTDQQIEAEIQAKGLTAPRIIPADLEANIASEHYFTAADGAGRESVTAMDVGANGLLPIPLHLLTFCVLVLKNGYTITGKSAVASPENFNAEIGRKIARADAVNQMWPLLGYELRNKLAAIQKAGGHPLDPIARVCHEVNRAYCEALGDTSQAAWENAPEWQRSSARMGVDLHQMGDFGPEASHVSWATEKIAQGWVFGPVKDADKKEHPCLVPFAELPREQQAKDFIFRAVVHALKA